MCIATYFKSSPQCSVCLSTDNSCLRETKKMGNLFLGQAGAQRKLMSEIYFIKLSQTWKCPHLVDPLLPQGRIRWTSTLSLYFIRADRLLKLLHLPTEVDLMWDFIFRRWILRNFFLHNCTTDSELSLEKNQRAQIKYRQEKYIVLAQPKYIVISYGETWNLLLPVNKQRDIVT